MKNKKKGYSTLLIITIVLTIIGFITLIPYGGATKGSMLGYMAYCTFSPISTVICFLLAGVTCRIRSKKFTEVAG